MGRTCKACGIEKELSEFPRNGKDRNKNIIYRPECKPCHSAEKKRRYAEDGKTADRQKTQKKDRYYSDDVWRERKLSANRTWYSYTYANDLEFKKRNNKRGYAWKKTPKGKASAQAVVSTRRARLKGAIASNDVLTQEKEFRLTMTECAFCGSTDGLSLDHIYPLAKGGSHSPDNWQCLCINCNSAKGAFA